MHNAYIEVAAEEGLIGLVALVVVALVVRRRVRRLRARPGTQRFLPPYVGRLSFLSSFLSGGTTTRSTELSQKPC